MQKDNLDVHVIPILVQKILKKVTDGVVGDVSAHDDVPGKDLRSQVPIFCDQTNTDGRDA